MLKTYEAKLYPSKRQQKVILTLLEDGRLFYNKILEIKIKTHKEQGKCLSLYDLQKMSKGKDMFPGLPASYKQVLIYRLIIAFERFYNVHKHFPRYKNEKRFRIIHLRQYGIDYRFEGKEVKLWKFLGSISMRGFRPLIGNPKEARIVKRASGWYLQYVDEYDHQLPVKRDVRSAVGIDVGIKNFVFDSNGHRIDHPRYYIKSQRKLAALKRSLSRKKKGSYRFRKLSLRVAKLHEHIANQRKDFLHKLSHHYVKNYDAIFVEAFNISELLENNPLVKHISDASWGRFLNFLEYKSAESAVVFEKVSARYTSQRCSSCGGMVWKTLSQRTHICPYYGYTADRDENSAINVLKAGLEQAFGKGFQMESLMSRESLPFRVGQFKHPNNSYLERVSG